MPAKDKETMPAINKGTMPANTVINNIRADTIAIANSAFYGCENLVGITIPAGVTSIGNKAFSGWTASQTINIEGHASQASADAAWGKRWRQEGAFVESRDINARINYLGK